MALIKRGILQEIEDTRMQISYKMSVFLSMFKEDNLVQDFERMTIEDLSKLREA